MTDPLGVQVRVVVDADQVAGSGLVGSAAIGRDVGVDHRDPLGLLGERGAAVHDHVAVQRDRRPGPREVGRHDPVGRRAFAARRQLGGLGLGADEVLEASAGQRRRVGDHHHEVERDRVVVPLVDRLADVGGFVVEVTEVHRHRVRCDVDPVDGGHHRRDIGIDAEIAEEP